MPMRPRRSVLYMPASNTRALAKAKTLPADALILDLEDAVAPDAKETAREHLVAELKAGGYGQRELVVRINSLDTEWGIDDLRTPDELHSEHHPGIRPAFGYPACPDHSEKFKLFDLLGAADAGIELTESAAMMPAASVSGLYFAHPQSRYFTVGRLGEDQIANYAKRKGQSVEQVERWLTTNLAYEPARC